MTLIIDARAAGDRYRLAGSAPPKNSLELDGY